MLRTVSDGGQRATSGTTGLGRADRCSSTAGPHCDLYIRSLRSFFTVVLYSLYGAAGVAETGEAADSPDALNATTYT